MDLVNNIEFNAKKIKRLLKEKTNVICRIQTTMDLKAYANSSLSENQISQFVEFTDCYQKESLNLKEALSNLSDFILKNDLLHNQTDYNFVYENLNVISENQFSAINSLKRLIDVGFETLAVL